MAVSVFASLASDKLQNLFGKYLWLLLMRKMASAVDGFEARAGNHRAISSAIGLADHAVVCAPQKQRRNANAVKAALQPRIMEIRTPGKAGGGFAGARGGENLI